MKRKIAAPPVPRPGGALSLQEALLLGAYACKHVLHQQPAIETFPIKDLPYAINLLWACSLLMQYAEELENPDDNH